MTWPFVPNKKLPQRLSYIPSQGTFEDDVPFPKVGYVNFLEGKFDPKNSTARSPSFWEQRQKMVDKWDGGYVYKRLCRLLSWVCAASRVRSNSCNRLRLFVYPRIQLFTRSHTFHTCKDLQEFFYRQYDRYHFICNIEYSIYFIDFVALSYPRSQVVHQILIIKEYHHDTLRSSSLSALHW